MHVPFTNSARKDGLQLKHWTKVASTNADYPFARFNKPIRMITYADNEYNTCLDGLLVMADTKPVPKLKKDQKLVTAQKPPVLTPATPPQKIGNGCLRTGIRQVPPQAPWTKKETDVLFDLCQQFDLRFAIVHDRYPEQLPERSVDELKDRYYSVAKRLVDHRSQAGTSKPMPAVLQKHCQAITMNPFDYEYECIRKNQLEWHYGRSKEELREEEETIRQARRIEANRKRQQKERQRLAKLLTPSMELGLKPEDMQSIVPQKMFPHRKVVIGAYARSSMIYTPVSHSARVSKRVDAALIELGVGLRPTPTSIVVDSFDLLRIEILAYIELQRTVLRKEEDTQILRVRVSKLKGLQPPPPPPGVTLSHKKRRADDVEIGSLFGPPLKMQKTSGATLLS